MSEGGQACVGWGWRRWVVVVIGAGLVALLVMGEPRAWLGVALERVRALGSWGPVLFVAVYVLACVLGLPGAPLTLGAGALFGFALGSLWVWTGAVLGATAAFWVGRHLARGWVERRLGARDRFRQLDEAVARQGWKLVLLTRLSPLLPFNVLNYAFGLTRVPAGSYILATAIGILPGTLMYVYLGSLAGGLAIGERGRTPAEWALLAAGLVATIGLAVMAARMAREALRKRLPPGT